jgi:hypothetical protein
VLWFTIWFMVILKIPVLYLAWVIWWAVKDPPDAWSGGDSGELLDGDGGPGGRPPRRRPRRGRPTRGPHGSPARRPARTVLARAKAGR